MAAQLLMGHRQRRLRLLLLLHYRDRLLRALWLGQLDFSLFGLLLFLDANGRPHRRRRSLLLLELLDFVADDVINVLLGEIGEVRLRFHETLELGQAVEGQIFDEHLNTLHLTEATQALGGGLAYEQILLLKAVEQKLKPPTELKGCPVEVPHFHDKDGLEGVDALLLQLP